jgi:hypothetical protein
MPYLGKAELKSSKIKKWTDTPGAVSIIPYSTIGFVPVNKESTWITINGIKQHDSSYSVQTTQILFTSYLAATDEVEIICIFDIGVPTYLDVIDNTVDVAALKTSDGTAGQVLITDGSGNLTFSSALAEAIEDVEILALVGL